jgi:hypothetical protein
MIYRFEMYHFVMYRYVMYRLETYRFKRDVVLLQHGLHVIPAVLDRVQVRAITRPVDHFEGLLGQERFYTLGGMAGTPSCIKCVQP